MCGQVYLAAIAISFKFAELLTNTLNKVGLVTLCFETIFNTKNLGYINETTLIINKLKCSDAYF